MRIQLLALALTLAFASAPHAQEVPPVEIDATSTTGVVESGVDIDFIQTGDRSTEAAFADVTNYVTGLKFSPSAAFTETTDTYAFQVNLIGVVPRLAYDARFKYERLDGQGDSDDDRFTLESIVTPLSPVNLLSGVATAIEVKLRGRLQPSVSTRGEAELIVKQPFTQRSDWRLQFNIGYVIVRNHASAEDEAELVDAITVGGALSFTPIKPLTLGLGVRATDGVNGDDAATLTVTYSAPTGTSLSITGAADGFIQLGVTQGLTF